MNIENFVDYKGYNPTNILNLNKTNHTKDKRDELKKACKSFEALILKQFLKEALKDFPSGQNKDFSFEVANAFFIDALAEKISESKSLGIAEKLYRDLSKYIDKQEEAYN